jgi:hypothetical protein
MIGRQLAEAIEKLNVSLHGSLGEFLSILRPAPVPTAEDAEQARTDQDGLETSASIEEVALPLIRFTGHATPLPQ